MLLHCTRITQMLTGSHYVLWQFFKTFVEGELCYKTLNLKTIDMSHAMSKKFLVAMRLGQSWRVNIFENLYFLNHVLRISLKLDHRID
jgi:hypothetical protein